MKNSARSARISSGSRQTNSQDFRRGSSPSTSNPSVRTCTVLCHASAFLGFLIPALGQFVGPLIVWLWKRDESPEIDAHRKESLNFQLSVFIYTAVFRDRLLHPDVHPDRLLLVPLIAVSSMSCW